jgi:hypothetical protein
LTAWICANEIDRPLHRGNPLALVTRSMKALLLGEPNLWVRCSDTEDARMVHWSPTNSLRGISLSFLMRGVEFRHELRLEAAARFFELSLSPRHMSQQCVQLLWTQDQQSEHKYEQDFGTQTHDSPLGYALVVGNGGCCASRLLFVSFHGYLEAADALSDSFTKFGELFGPEHKQGNSENSQQMHGLKQSFKHMCSFRLSENISKRVRKKCRRCNQ